GSGGPDPGFFRKESRKAKGRWCVVEGKENDTCAWRRTALEIW
ncbi:hypothetical protein GGI1_13689, partial [Acidithiobacillus sp. GGI-221]